MTMVLCRCVGHKLLSVGVAGLLLRGQLVLRDRNIQEAPCAEELEYVVVHFNSFMGVHPLY